MFLLAMAVMSSCAQRNANGLRDYYAELWAMLLTFTIAGTG